MGFHDDVRDYLADEHGASPEAVDAVFVEHERLLAQAAEFKWTPEHAGHCVALSEGWVVPVVEEVGEEAPPVAP